MISCFLTSHLRLVWSQTLLYSHEKHIYIKKFVGREGSGTRLTCSLGYQPLCKREEGSGNIPIPLLSRCLEVDMTNQITVWSSALISPRACVYFATNFLCHHEFQVKGDYLRHRWRTWLQFHKARARESFTILPTRTRCVRIPSDWLWEEPLLRCLTWCF